MIKGRLNINEKQVLYGMVRYPLLNDREIASKLNLKMTTVTAIKNRLKKREYYSTVRIPVLQYLDTELFCIINIKFNPLIPEKELVDKLKLLTKHTTEFFFVAIEGGNGFGLAFSRDYTDMLETVENFSMVARAKGFIENIGTPTKNMSFFPLKNSMVFNFFDFGPILSREFGITIGDEPKQLFPSLPKPKEVHLSNVEKRVLYGLVNYPELPDNKIAQKISVTRQVISKLKRTFEEDGVMKTIKLPNLKMLGYQILTISHHNHNPTTPISDREKGIKMIMEVVPHVLLISGNLESAMICICKDFQQFQELKTKAYTFYKKEDFLLDEPKINMYSIPNLKILTNHIYGPIVKKVLDVKNVK